MPRDRPAKVGLRTPPLLLQRFFFGVGRCTSRAFTASKSHRKGPQGLEELESDGGSQPTWVAQAAELLAMCGQGSAKAWPET